MTDAMSFKSSHALNVYRGVKKDEHPLFVGRYLSYKKAELFVSELCKLILPLKPTAVDL